MINAKVQRSWEEFLNPDLLRPRLIMASIFIAGFESLKAAVVDRVREFFWRGFDENGDKISPEYAARVLSRNRSPVYASLNWLKEMDAVTDEDIRAFDRVKARRNDLAHGLLTSIGEGLPADFAECSQDLFALLRKIEVWWIKEVEIPTNPDFDGVEVDESEILPGRLMVMQVLCDIALGDEEKSRAYLDVLRRQAAGS